MYAKQIELANLFFKRILIVYTFTKIITALIIYSHSNMYNAQAMFALTKKKFFAFLTYFGAVLSPKT